MADKRIWKFCLALVILIIAALAGFYLQRKTPPAPVAIQTGQTIDFSTGQAVVTETEEDRAALKKAQHEMEEATAEVTFQPKPQP